MTSDRTSETRGSLLAVTIAALVALAQPVSAAENGLGVYPLGLRSPLSGIVPAPGLYFQNDVSYYNGTASASRPLPLHGDLVADVRAVSWVDLPTLMWSTPVEIAGGNLALSATLPVGGPDIKARLGLASADLNSAFVRKATGRSCCVRVRPISAVVSASIPAADC